MSAHHVHLKRGGRPQPHKTISLRIDGEYITAHDDMTILEAAKSAGKYIPTLCHLDGLTDVGACRVCLVEVSGINRLLPACTTPVQDGMSVTTVSEKLTRYRRIAVELLFSDRNHICAVCVSNGHCELQTLAQRLGVTYVRFPYSYPKMPVDVSHPKFVLDHNRCIVCTRCIRVCDEVEGAHVWDIGGRGIGSKVVCEFNRKWGDAVSCTSCGKCVQVCPTGALAEKGKAVEEMTKSDSAISRLATRRGGSQ
jgi:bidirectional [NiFe] hydrogenase diaphorase subunit